MPLQQTSGNDTTDAYGGGAAVVPNYIEDVFSTYLYTGNGSTQTITNGIDLSTKGGMVWTKSRSVAKDNGMWDTVRGAGTGSGSPNNKTISSNGLNLSAFYSTDYLSSFSTTGFNVTYGSATYSVANQSGTTYVGWAFRKQPKFFDIQTWTGNGTAGKTITHALGSVPACIMVLCTTANYSWFVYHRSANAGGNTTSLTLNSTSAAANEGDAGIQNLTSTTFDLGGAGATSTRLNDSGQTYIAYIFAHDAGGFGLTGTDNVITCGTYTGNGSTTGPVVTLGYEPQWIITKRTDVSGAWWIQDNMRGLTQTLGSNLVPNTAAAEVTSATAYTIPIATGFKLGTTNADLNASGGTYVYVAIRRGPMKVPTVGTSVFGLSARTGTGANATVTGGQTDDLFISKNKASGPGTLWASRLSGTVYLTSSATTGENPTGTNVLQASPWDIMDGVKVGTSSNQTNANGQTFISYLVKRAPSFFDVVCYTGTGSATTQTHNLNVAPELIIVKRRNLASNWIVGATTIGYSNKLYFNLTNASAADSTAWNSTNPTSSVFSLGTNTECNAAASTYIAYLFASCLGVSSVGTYTGNGTTQTINCGFTSGSRFVMIKQTDSTGGWYFYDTARGMTILTDPYLFFDSTAGDAATLGSVTTVTTGFSLDATILAAINTNAATYIYLAIA